MRLCLAAPGGALFCRAALLRCHRCACHYCQLQRPSHDADSEMKSGRHHRPRWLRLRKPVLT